VVGALFEAECRPWPDAATVARQIWRDDAKELAQFGIGWTPVKVGGHAKAVQEHQRLIRRETETIAICQRRTPR
jgi:hypothetical protein